MITKEKVEAAIAAGVIRFSHDTAGHRICKIGERGFRLPETTGNSSDSDDALTVFTMLDAYKTNPYDWDEYDYFDAVLSRNGKAGAASLPYQQELSWLLDAQNDSERQKRLEVAYIAASLMRYRRHLSVRDAAELVGKYENAVMRFGTHMWPNEVAFALGAVINKYPMDAVLALDDDTFWRMLHDAAFHQMMSKMTAVDSDVAVNHNGRRFHSKKNEYIENDLDAETLTSYTIQMDVGEYFNAESEKDILRIAEKQVRPCLVGTDKTVVGYTLNGYADGKFRLLVYI